jgi:hypothetical protein
MAFKWQPIKIYTEGKSKSVVRAIMLLIMVYFWMDIYFAIANGYLLDRRGDVVEFKSSGANYIFNLLIDLLFGFVGFYYAFFGIKTKRESDE